MKNKNVSVSVDDDVEKHYSKFEDPLWNEEVPVSKTIRIQLDNKSEDVKDCQWKFFENNKLICFLSGNNLTKKQIKFLQTPQGFSFLLTKYKAGDISVRTIKAELKNVLGDK